MVHQSSVAEDFAAGRRQVELMFTDVDGTLLDPEQKLRPKVKAAVQAAAKAGVPLILATGKGLGPWIQPVLQELQITEPRVHMQGLYILAADGQVIFSRRLDESVFDDALAFSTERGVGDGMLPGFRGARTASQPSRMSPGGPSPAPGRQAS